MIKQSLICSGPRSIIHSSHPLIQSGHLSKPINFIIIKCINYVVDETALFVSVFFCFESYLKRIVSEVPSIHISVIHDSFHLIQSHVSFYKVRSVLQLVPDAQTSVVQS